MSNFGDASFVEASDGNTTSAPLSASGAYVGTVEENEYPAVMVNIETDVGGTLFIGFSVDGVNWKEEELNIDHAVFSYVFRRVKTGPFFRLRYVNGSGAQSFFRLNSYYGDFEREIPIERSSRNSEGVAVFVQDQTTEMLDLDFLQEVKTGLSLATDSVATSRDITLVPGHGMITGTYPVGDVGTMLEIGSPITGRFIQAKVLAVTGDVITLNQLIGNVFPAGSSVNTGNRNLALTDGSATPVIFRVEPSPVQAGDITRIILAIVGPTAMDFSTFGSDPELLVGLLFRIRRADGSYKNLRTVNVNIEAMLWGFENNFFAPKTGNADHGIAFRITFAGQSNHGVTSRLDGTQLEQLECVVLDDLTAGTNSTIRVMAEGSELQS